MVTNTMTINKIVDIFKDWSIAKAPFVNDFGFGPIWDFGTSRQMKYPCMWVDLETSSNINISNRSMVPEFNLIVMFLDKENIQDNVEDINGMRSNNVGHIMSDTFQLGQDFINDLIISYNGSGFSLINQVTANKIYDETTDKVYGWAFSFTMRTSVINCKDASIIPPSSCFPAKYQNSDESYEQLINSGSTFIAPDITVTLGDGVQTFPSNTNIDLSNYYPAESLLPSGTYIPKNTVTGPFDLLWQNQTTNVVTGTGTIENTVNIGNFEERGTFKINHLGNFELKFKFTSDNLITGLSYFTDFYQTHSYGIEHSLILQSGILYVYGNAYTHFSINATNADNFSIERIGDQLNYKLNNTIIYTQTLDFITGFVFKTAMKDIGQVYDIQLIIP